MSLTLRQLRERFREQRDARLEAIASQLDEAAAAHDHAFGSHAIGARVFDTVSGEEGEIVGRTRENVVVHPAER